MALAVPVPVKIGNFVLVRYVEEPELWHEHYVIGLAPGGRGDEFVIFTADGDMYVETLSTPPHLGVAPCPDGHRLPQGFGAAHGKPCYRFRSPLQAARRRSLLVEARHDFW